MTRQLRIAQLLGLFSNQVLAAPEGWSVVLVVAPGVTNDQLKLLPPVTEGWSVVLVVASVLLSTARHGCGSYDVSRVARTY